MWNTIFFDFDGTLVDTAEGLTKGLAQAFDRELGMKVEDLSSLRRFIGPPFYVSFKEELQLDDAQVAACVAAYREYYSAQGMYECALYPGMKELLDKLAAEHFTLCVASSKPLEFVEAMLTHLQIRPYFTVVEGARADRPNETKADAIRYALEKIGMAERKSEVVLIGDTKYDMIGAQEAGIDTIGVTYGYGDRATLESFVPACIVDNTEELGNVLIGQARAAMGPAFAAGQPKAAEKESIWTRLWRLGYPMLLGFGVQNAIAFIISAAMGVLLAVQGYNETEISDMIYGKMLIMLGIANTLSVPLFYLFFRMDEKRRQASQRGLLKKNRFNVGSFIAICLFTLGASQLVNVFVSVLNIPSDVYDELNETVFTSMSLPWQIIIIAIVTPVAEEMLFRGLIYRRLREYRNAWISSIVCGALFGVYHGNLLQGVYTALLGFVICVIYEHYGTIWAPIIAHFANNLASTLESYFWGDGTDFAMWAYVLVSFLFLVVGGLWIFLHDRRVNQI